MAGWHTWNTVYDAWPDSSSIEGSVFDDLLDVARDQVLAYANIEDPAEQDPAQDVPAPLRVAQLMQARNIWNATRVDTNSSGFGDGEFTVRVYPLDWMVRQIIRPKSGKPVMF